MRIECEIWKFEGDRFTRKFLNLKFMMSHEFLYACDTGERERFEKSAEMKD